MSGRLSYTEPSGGGSVWLVRAACTVTRCSTAPRARGQRAPVRQLEQSHRERRAQQRRQLRRTPTRRGRARRRAGL